MNVLEMKRSIDAFLSSYNLVFIYTSSRVIWSTGCSAAGEVRAFPKGVQDGVLAIRAGCENVLRGGQGVGLLGRRLPERLPGGGAEQRGAALQQNALPS